MERIGGQEPLVSRIDVEVANRLFVVDDPFGVGRGSDLGIVGEPGPVEQPAADDLRGLGLDRHDNGLAQAVE